MPSYRMYPGNSHPRPHSYPLHPPPTLLMGPLSTHHSPPHHTIPHLPFKFPRYIYIIVNILVRTGYCCVSSFCKAASLVQMISMIQWEQRCGQELARKIKADTWERWRKAYRKKFKKEWSDSLFTVVASISLISIQTNSYTMVSIGFGTKSLPLSVIREYDKNALLSDMHAQMLAIRGFQKFITQEVSRQKSQYFQWQSKRRKFSLKSEFQVVMYCSQVFCGDCCINEQEQSFSGAKPLRYFKNQKYPQMKFEPCILRTKPGRLDLPPDKRSPLLSCSDLIALANLVGIQGKQLFNLVTPIYLSTIAVDCQPSLREQLGKGMDFPKRLSSIFQKPEKLIERQIFNIVVEGKEKKISRQFHRNEPRILVLERQGQEKSRDREGFSLCGIISQSVEEWINGKSGLPEGTSLKSYKGKGKVSAFSDVSIGKGFPREAEAADGFKYEAIQYSLRRLFGEWVGDCLE